MSFRILAFALALMLAACQESQPNRPSSNRTANTYSVLIEKVEERLLPVIYSVPGTIVAKDHLQVASRITGYIDHIDVDEGDHPIVPVMLGDAVLAQKMSKKLLEHGVYAIGFFFPVVAKGKARIRTQISAAHTKQDLDTAISAFAETYAELTG